MTRTATLVAVLWLIVANPAGAQDAPARRAPLGRIFLDRGPEPFSMVKKLAEEQAAPQWQMDRGPLYKSTPVVNANPNRVVDQVIFEGVFSPRGNASKLAIFSDDGCDVWINGEQVLFNYRKGQHLPDTTQSLHPLKVEFAAGKKYAIRIRYGNTIFGGPKDIDGCTLFAYNGGGTSEPGKQLLIKRRKDGEAEYKEIKDDLAIALPGEYMDLKVEAGNMPLTAIEWKIPDKSFKKYTVTYKDEKEKTEGVLTPLKKDPDLIKETVQFYWANSGEKTVKVKATVGGKEEKAEATLSVKKPTATLEATQGIILVKKFKPEKHEEGWYLGLFKDEEGKFPGMHFNAKVTVPTEFKAGEWCYVQLGRPRIEITKKNLVGEGTYTDIKTSKVKELDKTFPYDPEPSKPLFVTGDMAVKSADSPNSRLDEPAGKVRYHLEYTFAMYILFKPAGKESNYVPLRRLDWSCKGTAEKKLDGWILLSGTAVKTNGVKDEGKSVEDDKHPEWKTTLQKLPYEELDPSKKSKD